MFVDPNFQKNAFRIAAPAPGDSQELEHILELMLSIEVTAARYAAQRRGDQDLKKMKQALVGMEYALVNDKLGDEEDYQFHLAIVQATQPAPGGAERLPGSQCTPRDPQRATTPRACTPSAWRRCRASTRRSSRPSRRGSDAAGRAAEQHLRNAADRLRLFQAERPAPV